MYVKRPYVQNGNFREKLGEGDISDIYYGAVSDCECRPYKVEWRSDW
jgi:hypothetical protein